MVRIRCGNTDAQRAGRLLLLAHDFALSLDQLRQCLTAFLVITTTTVGQLDATGGTRKQAHTEAFFHARHRAAHRRRRYACHQCGGSKAAGLGGQAKQFDAAQLKIVEESLHDLLHRGSNKELDFATVDEIDSAVLYLPGIFFDYQTGAASCLSSACVLPVMASPESRKPRSLPKSPTPCNESSARTQH
ncbi:hypothetical protein EMIT0P294_60133 [Pseudomonas sp. IT-P294]